MAHSTRFLDLTGRKFGRLTVLHRLPNRGPQVVWLCRCDCGTEKAIIRLSLTKTKNPTLSCGCYNREVHRGNTYRRTHNMKNTPEYQTWINIKRRCHNRAHVDYKLYGARGIVVCSRWRDSFLNFLNDMGKRPSANHSIDRFPNNDGPYSPDNCRWATTRQQARNKRNNRKLELHGATFTAAEWTERLGLKRSTLRQRLKYGWSVEEALTIPVQRR